ncbi:MAG: type I-B CRISPR-associated protein Cas7/Cst2/DevR [Deltaproteobacteria bacterium]|nr:type I-B CRISPR-associated protein Cas7/Cst2/DevR [Deltaproteobacteria bacterium]
MSKHLFGMVLTHQGIYANNRGENEGTATTLQKVLGQDGDLYTTVSAESIRYALREGWQMQKLPLNRIHLDHQECKIQDKTFTHWHKHLDDDALGYMHATKETLSRRGILEITRAISTTPWRGEIMQNFASPGSNAGVSHKNPIPYAVEVHHTRYQFGFALTPASLGREGNGNQDNLSAEEKRKRLQWLLEGFLNLRRVGGNHARYLSDYSPEAIILRWTDDPAPRILYCFEQDDKGRISLRQLLTRLKSGDILPEELIIGTSLDLPELGEANIKPKPGVKQAIHDLIGRVTDDDLNPR